MEAKDPKDNTLRLGNPGMYTHINEFEFAVQAGGREASKFKFWHSIRDEKFVPKTDFDKQMHAHWLKSRYERGMLLREGGQGQRHAPLFFMAKPADAQVCALDGPLTLVVKAPEYQTLQRGEGGCDVAFYVVVLGRPYRGADHQCYHALSTKEVPEAAHLEVEVEYPAKKADAPPLRRKYVLKERC